MRGKTFICHECLLLPCCGEYCNDAKELNNLSIFYHSGYCPDCTHSYFEFLYVARTLYIKCKNCNSTFSAGHNYVWGSKPVGLVSEDFRTYADMYIQMTKLGKNKLPDVDMEPRDMTGVEIINIIKEGDI